MHYFDATGTGYARYSAIRTYFQSWLMTIADAISFAERHPEFDSQRIGLLGVSLGGYLRCRSRRKTRAFPQLPSLMGGMPEEFLSEARQMPPTLLLHGEADPVVPVNEARKVAALLERLGTPHELKIYPGQGHSFCGMAQMDALTRTLRFLSRHLKKENAAFGLKDLLLSFR